MSSPIDISTLSASLSQDTVQKIRLDQVRQNLTDSGKDEKKLKEACEGLESLFVYNMIKEMRASIPKEGLFSSKYQDKYQDMFDQEWAKDIAKDGGIGLGKIVYADMKTNLAKKGQSASDQNKELNPLDVQGGLNSLVPPAASAPRYVPHPLTSLSALSDLDMAAGVSPLSLSPSANIAANHAAYSAASTLTSAEESPLHLPVTGKISSTFGPRKDPFTGSSRQHNGLDIAAPSGTDISACWDGTVSFSGKKLGYGNVTIIDHPGGWQSIYGHNSKNLLTAGTRVKAGQKIAEVGSTGRSTGPHVHFELRKNGIPQDPVTVQANSAKTGKLNKTA